MTKPLAGHQVGEQIRNQVPDAVIEASEEWVLIKPESLLAVANFLKTTPGLEFDYLNCITGVDYLDYLEVVYHLTSMRHNHGIVLKARCSRENAEVPSLVGLWRGADLQEREIYDLLGITFVGHPNLKRIFMWQGFEGHPLRRDYL
ncbi:MAG: NADH-quinone oxidoreductase subunit C [Chloroflexi bacterium]|nr:MAG: NADH-quinone oxidoreductase subunit C [Chloroflexota bacterium]RLC95812.1 MAG: NADH-quinone oxidoreductase subunit C [Chloroflexota bacterium]